MKKRSFCLLMVLCLCCAPAWSAARFATARLQAMASILSLQRLDTLAPGLNTRYVYNGRPLAVRVSPWSEVEHIGLYLFADSLRAQAPSPVYDFLERYLLELHVVQGTPHAVRFGLNRVQLLVGDASTALGILPGDEFAYTSTALRSYRAAWKRQGREVLALSFDMDVQLLKGCDATELEKNFLRDIQRYHAPFTAQPEPAEGFPADGLYHVLPGSTFMIDAIRSDLYYKKEAEGWKLLSGADKPTQSIANAMLSPHTEGRYSLAFTLDMYGYKEAGATVSLTDWLNYCLQEGCTPFFGLKHKSADHYAGTAFMVNHQSGYVHMLSVEFPTDVLTARQGTIRGRMFVYIPLHNLSDRFFQTSEYSNIY